MLRAYFDTTPALLDTHPHFDPGSVFYSAVQLKMPSVISSIFKVLRGTAQHGMA